MTIPTYEDFIKVHGIFKLKVGDRFRPWDEIFNARKIQPVILDIKIYEKQYCGLTHFVKYTADVRRGYMEQSINLTDEEDDLTRHYYWQSLSKDQHTFLTTKLRKEYGII